MKIHHLGAKDYVTGKWYKVYHPTPYTLHPIPYKPSVHGEAKARHALSGLLKICVNL